MAQIVEYGFPTLNANDIVTHISGFLLDDTDTITVNDLVTNGGGLFYWAEDENGELVMSCSKQIGVKLEITTMVNAMSVTNKAELFKGVYDPNTLELIGTRPPVHR